MTLSKFHNGMHDPKEQENKIYTKTKRYFCGLFVLLLFFVCLFFASCVSHAFTSVHCCLVVTCWEKADLLGIVGDVNCIFVTFQCGILGQM